MRRPAPASGGWTIDTALAHLLALREADQRALDAALVGQTKAVDAALTSQEKATLLAEEMNQHWRDAANEWRGAMDDRDRKSLEALVKYAQRTEVDLMISALDEKIRGLKKEVENVQTISQLNAGRSAGVSAAWSWLLGAVGLVAGGVAIVVATR